MRSGFFDAQVLGYDEYGNPQFDRAESAGFLASFVSGFVRTGVSSEGGGLTVSPGEGMQVQVSAGKCFIEGYFGWAEEPETLTLGPADSLLNRIDAVVARLDLVERTVTLAVKAGVPKAQPNPPDMSRPALGMGDLYELCLAQVAVHANAVSLTEENLFDTRPDPELCGWITSPLSDPEKVPYAQRTGGEIHMVLSDTAACRCGVLSSLSLSGSDPADGYYRAYDISFSSGDTAAALSVPESWEFVGQDSVDGVFVPAPNSHYEMVGAWHNGILRWVVLAW